LVAFGQHCFNMVNQITKQPVKQQVRNLLWSNELSQHALGDTTHLEIFNLHAYTVLLFQYLSTMISILQIKHAIGVK
jgi:hypothetical protein